MTPHGKLVTANILILAGIAPLMPGISWILVVILYAQQHKGEMGGSDAFLMIAVLIVSYAFAAVVAGSSALWSWSLMRRSASLRTRSAAFMILVLGVMLVAPILCYAGIQFRIF